MTKTKKTDVKDFIGYKTGRKIRPLFIKFQQMIGFFNKFRKSQYMSLMIKD